MSEDTFVRQQKTAQNKRKHKCELEQMVSKFRDIFKCS
ncbi:unnamed protein product [Tenebrio molitor]|nr:unnamed protein product [Tenebrio molitor]